jgi:hypothetical protein
VPKLSRRARAPPAEAVSESLEEAGHRAQRESGEADVPDQDEDDVDGAHDLG